jgi:hypothetical protein
MREILVKPYFVPAVLAAAVVVWMVIDRGDAIFAGHPSYAIFYVLAAAVAGSSILFATLRSGRRSRLWLTIPGAIGLIVLAGISWLLAPFPATEVAVAALQSDSAVSISSSSTEIVMRPAGEPPEGGLVFQPGARVDSRAYAHILRPLAEAGYEVVIVKQPLGVAFFAPGFAPGWAADHPEVARWVVGGHSLGGVVAAQNAADPNEIDHLVLWASYPAGDVSGSTFDAVSIFGTNDGLTTLDNIDDSIEDLPDGANFVPVDGAIHSHFGDYGLQPGDGEPEISRQEAQDLIVRATLAFMMR